MAYWLEPTLLGIQRIEERRTNSCDATHDCPAYQMVGLRFVGVEDGRERMAEHDNPEGE